MFSHQRSMLYPLLGRIIRVLAVIALALSPVWGFPTVHAASSSAPSRYPIWPSFLSTGCQAIQGPTGSTTISCGDGSFLLTQVNSGYACNQLDINISTFSSGHFLATASVNSGSQSNSVDITEAGDYYMQFPGFLVNNLITIQIQAVSAGVMSIQSIQTNPCPVATITPTVNPSFTPTNTPIPSNTPVGSTYTVTPIPTFTPLPSGHSTFTRTPTPGPGSNTATPTVTPPAGPAYVNCGSPSYPLLNCTWLPIRGNPGTYTTPPDFWTNDTFYPVDACWALGDPVLGLSANLAEAESVTGTAEPICHSTVVAGATGSIFVQYKATIRGGSDQNWFFCATSCFNMLGSYSSCPVSGSAWCIGGVGSTTSGNSTTFSVNVTRGSASPDDSLEVLINNTWIGSSGSTATPVPTFTPTVTNTPAPGTSTPTQSPTLTPVPIPGAMSTPIPTSTECPGGCVVAQLTAIPGVATRFTVDTSPFSPFTSLSVSRSSCAPFGFVQIPYPVIHGTPALGSTNPLSITWTIPATSTWDDTHPFSNTAIQPCAMVNEIPTSIWDMTYWLSVFFLAVVFIMWLIGYVGRLSGDETING